MKKRIISVSILSLSAGTAHAQSSVTLYGILDAGINYISNDGGKSNVTITTGVPLGNRWGLKGIEDLGGGLKTIFQLESGFSLGSGALGQGGRLFGRQAWIGLSSTSWGSVTMGRQLDSGIDYVQSLTGILYTGIAHPFDNDNLDNDTRINNSVKFASATYGGLKFGGMYAFSNNTSFASNRAWSLGVGYSYGFVTLAASYLRLDEPNANTSGAVSGDYINVTTTSALQHSGLSGPVARQNVLAIGASYALSLAEIFKLVVASTNKFQAAFRS